jgi:hypothetical protein
MRADFLEIAFAVLSIINLFVSMYHQVNRNLEQAFVWAIGGLITISIFAALLIGGI